ncbi:MAG: hypothetical protein PHS26_09805, partial [Actinomycetota bacterium]|nr:hypothetical protein [Actinomycetota bacterium]
MECSFHAGSEAITTCVQCETPICPLCVEETSQVHLCLNCYRARIEELSAGLSSASARLAVERQKGEARARSSRKKKKGEREAAGPAESLWEKEGAASVTPGEMAPPAEAAPAAPGAASAAAPAAAAAATAAKAPGKKELARMQKEEARRLKEEKKAARKAAAEQPVVPAV